MRNYNKEVQGRDVVSIISVGGGEGNKNKTYHQSVAVIQLIRQFVLQYGYRCTKVNKSTSLQTNTSLVLDKEASNTFIYQPNAVIQCTINKTIYVTGVQM